MGQKRGTDRQGKGRTPAAVGPGLQGGRDDQDQHENHGEEGIGMMMIGLRLIKFEFQKKDGSEGGSRTGAKKTGGLGLLPPPPGGNKIAPPPSAASPSHQPAAGSAGQSDWGEFTSAG